MEECVLHRPFPTPEPLAAVAEQPIQIEGLPPVQPQQFQHQLLEQQQPQSSPLVPQQLFMGSSQQQNNVVFEQPSLPSALQPQQAFQQSQQPPPQMNIQQLRQQLDLQLQQHLQEQQQSQSPLMPQGLSVQPIISPLSHVPESNGIDIRRYMNLRAH